MKKCVFKHKGEYYTSEKYVCNEKGQIFNSITKRELIGSNDKNGYLLVNLIEDFNEISIDATFRKHRVIALTFLGIPKEGVDIVDHKNGNKKDNEITNLEWVSIRENTIRAKENGLFNYGSLGNIYCYKTDGSFIGIYDSIRQAAEKLNLNRHCISRVLNGQFKQSAGYYFSYEEVEDKTFFNSFNIVAVRIYDRITKEIKEYPSLIQASKDTAELSREVITSYRKKNSDKNIEDFVYPKGKTKTAF